MTIGRGLDGEKDIHRLQVTVDKCRVPISWSRAQLTSDPRCKGLQPGSQCGDLWAGEEAERREGREGSDEAFPGGGQIAELLRIARRESEGASVPLQPLCCGSEEGLVLPRRRMKRCRGGQELACLRW